MHLLYLNDDLADLNIEDIIWKASEVNQCHIAFFGVSLQFQKHGC